MDHLSRVKVLLCVLLMSIALSMKLLYSIASLMRLQHQSFSAILKVWSQRVDLRSVSLQGEDWVRDRWEDIASVRISHEEK
ncbi:hypothetical protein AK961_03590 [Serratia marcescens]|nr:hypothetical protein AK961_03590 [Serratia marcescens]